jgi:spermidine/putrescine transport system substrate-binding protein
MVKSAWLGGLLLAVALVVGGVVAITFDTTKTLRIFIWEDYIAPEVYRLFERELGVKVIEDNYASNEDMRAKLQAGGVLYDLVVPSDYMVTLLRKDGLLLELDLRRMPNLTHITTRFRDPPYDPGHRYSVPYQWGITGIGYHKSQVIPSPTSWADLFQPARIERYRNRISMLNDMREVVGAALITLGYSPDSADPQQLAQAQELLQQQKPFLAKYDSESFKDSLASGETVLAQGWSGDIAMAQTQNPEIGFAIPQEGTFIFVDNWAIPKGARHKELAEEFINFVLRPEISATIVNHVRYASVNEAATPLVKPEILNGPSYHVPEGTKLWWLADLGRANELYERVWIELKGR